MLWLTCTWQVPAGVFLRLNDSCDTLAGGISAHPPVCLSNSPALSPCSG